jgi:NAD(P)H-hydrate epimerase
MGSVIMRIGTSEMTSNMDKECTQKLGIPLIVLMENAALAVLKNIHTDKYNKYCIICGTGNNGGDGFALARHLISLNKYVHIVIVKNDDGKFSECSKTNFNILKNMKANISFIEQDDDIDNLIEILRENELIIDAILGTGIRRNVEGIFSKVIDSINDYSKYIISIDVPSGLNSDNGIVMGNSIKANKTICFEVLKRGFLTYGSDQYTGKIVVEKIGFPECVIQKFHNDEYITQESYVKSNIKNRNKYNFKSDFGKVSIIAGSEGFYGAAYICTESCVKSGSGLVTLITSKDVQEKLGSKFIEAMTSNFDDVRRVEKLIKNCDAIAFGPGIGNNKVTFDLLDNVMKEISCPIVIDADGLNVMEGRCNKFLEWNKRVVITPHFGEMSRLTGLSIDYIRNNRIDVAKEFAKKYNVVVLLKGYQTIITDGEITFVNPTGNSSMATGGMGDCLTGIIASFIGQGMDLLDAAICGAYIHGEIGGIVSKEKYSINATDIMSNISQQIRKYI